MRPAEVLSAWQRAANVAARRGERIKESYYLGVVKGLEIAYPVLAKPEPKRAEEPCQTRQISA